jgi:hypothetical protein
LISFSRRRGDAIARRGHITSASLSNDARHDAYDDVSRAEGQLRARDYVGRATHSKGDDGRTTHHQSCGSLPQSARSPVATGRDRKSPPATARPIAPPVRWRS